MKQLSGFWGSLELYLGKLVQRSHLPQYWRTAGVGLILVVIVSSVVNAKNSTTGAVNLDEVVEQAGRLGDYQLAQQLWTESMDKIEDIVYPERRIEQRIAELEAKLVDYPGNRQIYLALGDLYGQLAKSQSSNYSPITTQESELEDRAREYREKARILDPNNEVLK